jgi:hypothetical protein
VEDVTTLLVVSVPDDGTLELNASLAEVVTGVLVSVLELFISVVELLVGLTEIVGTSVCSVDEDDSTECSPTVVGEEEVGLGSGSDSALPVPIELACASNSEALESSKGSLRKPRTLAGCTPDPRRFVPTTASEYWLTSSALAKLVKRKSNMVVASTGLKIITEGSVGVKRRESESSGAVGCMILPALLFSALHSNCQAE